MVLFVFSDLGLGTVVNIVFRAGDPDAAEWFLVVVSLNGIIEFSAV